MSRLAIAIGCRYADNRLEKYNGGARLLFWYLISLHRSRKEQQFLLDVVRQH